MKIADERDYYKTRKKLKEKDKQIELMAKFISQTEIDELICKDIERCIADDEYSNCYRCIKQYFENKVKERQEYVIRNKSL